MNENIMLMITGYLRQRSAHRRRRRKLILEFLNSLKRREKYIQSAILLKSELENSIQKPRIRTCRRLPRNTGWWETVSTRYSEKRFKKNFRVSKETFRFLAGELEALERESVAEDPISVEERLAITLYRLGRGSYYHTISEMSGIAESTICRIVPEVCGELVQKLWATYVRFPESELEFTEKLQDMKSLWHFGYAFCAADGSHLPIKLPEGGDEARKSYRCFKNFYSIVLMAMVDANLRFIWASCGFPGNSHDSTIFQSTQKYSNIVSGDVLPEVIQYVDGDVNYPVPPIVLGDSAFPLQTWLLKPYGDAVPSKKQRYFNYRLSRARIVSECPFGQLKGRFRILHRRCESSNDIHKIVALACVLLHNICIAKGDLIPTKSDLSLDENGERLPSVEVRNVLHMIQGVNDHASPSGKQIRNRISDEFWKEHQAVDAGN